MDIGLKIRRNPNFSLHKVRPTATHRRAYTSLLAEGPIPGQILGCLGSCFIQVVRVMSLFLFDQFLNNKFDLFDGQFGHGVADVQMKPDPHDVFPNVDDQQLDLLSQFLDFSVGGCVQAVHEGLGSGNCRIQVNVDHVGGDAGVAGHFDQALAHVVDHFGGVLGHLVVPLQLGYVVLDGVQSGGRQNSYLSHSTAQRFANASRPGIDFSKKIYTSSVTKKMSAQFWFLHKSSKKGF